MVLLAVPGCGPSWTTFAFRYSSNHHLAPSQRLLELGAPPTVVAAFLKKEITRNAGSVVREESGIGKTYGLNRSSEQNWKASRRVAEEEWASIRAVNRKQYDAIDRSGDVLRGVPEGDMEVRFDPVEGILIQADVWPRPARSARDHVKVSGNLTETRANVRTFSTRVAFYIWRNPAPGSPTNVYAWAVPITEGIAAGDGRELSLEWLPFSTGEQDAEVVRNYLSLLKRADSRYQSRKSDK